MMSETSGQEGPGPQQTADGGRDDASASPSPSKTTAATKALLAQSAFADPDATDAPLPIETSGGPSGPPNSGGGTNYQSNFGALIDGL